MKAFKVDKGQSHAVDSALTNQGGSGQGGRGQRRWLVAHWNSLSLIAPSKVPKI